MSLSQKTNEENIYIVEKIHESKVIDNTLKYLVEWVNHPNKEDYTYEPEENLQDCTVFQEY